MAKSAVIFGLRGTITRQFVTGGGVRIKKPQQRNIEHNNKRLDEFYVRDKVVSRIYTINFPLIWGQNFFDATVNIQVFGGKIRVNMIKKLLGDLDKIGW